MSAHAWGGDAGVLSWMLAEWRKRTVTSAPAPFHVIGDARRAAGAAPEYLLLYLDVGSRVCWWHKAGESFCRMAGPGYFTVQINEMERFPPLQRELIEAFGRTLMLQETLDATRG